MGKRTGYLFVILLCIALFTGRAAKAQDIFLPRGAPLPGKFKGNWALPDCETYDEAAAISRYFYLKSTRSGSRLQRADGAVSKKDYWLLTLDDQVRPVRVEEDGILKIGKPARKASQKWPQRWEALKLDGKQEYMRCADPPGLLPPVLLQVMEQIDALAETCSAQMTAACQDLLFSIADSDKDNRISLMEMKQAAAQLAGLAALLQNNTVSNTLLDSALREGQEESARLAGSGMKYKNGMTYRDFSLLITTANSDLLRKTLEAVGASFPALRPLSAIDPARQPQTIDSARQPRDASDR